jgi:hypothetical protein
MISGYLWVDVLAILCIILFIDIFWGMKRDDED